MDINKIRDLYQSMDPLPEGIEKIDLPENNSYRGKVRDLKFLDTSIEMFHSDRLSAFDRHIAIVPYKGSILCAIAKFWWENIDIPNHFIKSKDDRTLVVKKAEPIKIEVIIRAYLAGSIAREYGTGRREFFGTTLPDGLKSGDKLPEKLITPTSKAEVYQHDQEISEKDITAHQLCSKIEWEKIKTMSFQLFNVGEKISSRAGLTLLDTKYEFGRLENGEIIVIDEIHTPDSSRFIYEDGSQLDKEIIRSWLIEQGFKGEKNVPKIPQKLIRKLALAYIDVFERLTNLK